MTKAVDVSTAFVVLSFTVFVDILFFVSNKMVKGTFFVRTCKKRILVVSFKRYYIHSRRNEVSTYRVKGRMPLQGV